MANERLTRTPTSIGNKRVLTWSGWVKRHKFSNAYVGSQNFFRASNGSGGDCGWRFDYSTPADGLRVHLDGSAAGNVQGDAKHRDPSSWMNVMLSFNSTLEQSSARVQMYIDGVLMPDNNTGYPTQNYQTSWNDLVPQYIGAAWNGGSEYYHGEMCDIFMVDGQALTPDVFGFYKEGKGYQSSGTAQATDFRPGQWVPKAPRTIKSEINRRGGFGVNGFYLPMNDSSNFGADFHCAPNSIIKLKGEDLPQPRNGAPTTSDAYVSQLREDPYAANLVLAVPGISTATGSNLVTNGNFDSDVSGWGVNGGTFTWNNGRAQHVTTGTNYPVYQQITGLTIGQRYTFQYTHYSGYTAAYINTTPVSSGNILSLGDTTISSEITKRGSFTATATSHYVVIYGIGSNTSIWDDVIVKQEDAPRDYSADIKGSGTNKTLTAVGEAGVGYEIPSYYGSAIRFGNNGTNGAGNADMINVPTSSDFVFNGDVTIECWMYVKSTPTTSGAFLGQWQSGGGTNRNLMMYLDTSNRVTSYFNSSGTNYNTGASPALALNQWHHIVTEKDGSNFRLYLNGVCVAINTNTPTAGNTAAIPFTIGAETESGGTITGADYGIDGYIQDVRVYKGVAKYKGGFDVPKPYTPVGIQSWRQVSDTCNGNNFATLNPLSYQTTGTYGTSVPVLTNGNLTYTHGQTGQWERSNASFGVGEGKWYFECKVVTRPVTGNSENWAVGVRESDGSLFHQCTDAFEDLGDHVYWIDAGTAKIVSNQDRSAGSTSGITAVANGDIINIAFEKTATTLKVWFGVNGTYFNSGNPSAGTSPAVNHSTTTEFIIPALSFYRYSGQEEPVATVNFGQNPTFSGQATAGTYTDASGKGLFKYQPPSGYLALCEDNLPTPAIADPGDHFKTVLYTGDGNEGHSITGVGFKPDLVWIKCRSHADNHTLSDTVRGPGLALYSDLVNTEHVSNIRIQSFNDNGFTTGSSGDTNTSGRTFCAWCWKAGGAAVSNTDGSITSQVSANQTAGFSIVSYTSTGSAGTVGHGLGKRPKVVLIKRRTGANTNWPMWFDGVSTNTDKVMQLNLTNGEAAAAVFFNSGDTTTTTFPLGSGGGQTNDSDGNSDSYIAYVWTEIEGFSKFGNYTGTGGTDGAFVYCGFKPAFLMIKRTDTTGEWWMYDNSRGPINPIPRMLMANNNLIEQEDSGSYMLDFLSNGFKWRSGLAASNGSGGSYIFMAFAESPFQTANAK